MESEIVEEAADADAPSYVVNKDGHKELIRKILQRQRVHCLSSSSFSSAAVSSSSSSSLSSSHRNSNLLHLMKIGSTSLRRLFAMEHISLSTHFDHFSGSPVTKPILLWGTDSDEGAYDPWDFVPRTELSFNSPYNSTVTNARQAVRRSSNETTSKPKNLKLERTRSFRRLPMLSSWIWSGFRLRSPFRRLRVMICGRKF